MFLNGTEILYCNLHIDPEKNGKLSDLGVRINQEKDEQNRLLSKAKPKNKEASSGVSFQEETPYVPPSTGMSNYVFPHICYISLSN